MRSLLATHTLKATGFVSVRHHKTQRGYMNKKDKKFIAALAFLQTGILVAVISFSASFWHQQIQECKQISHLYKLSQWVKGENQKKESKTKITNIKQHYETQGIGAEEH